MFTRRSFIEAVPALYAFAKAKALARDDGSKNNEYHVSRRGDDKQDGSVSRLLRTITAAAARAYPGDTITVHSGVYRERVAPPRGGTSNANRIVYQAAPGERVEISGAEPVNGWTTRRRRVESVDSQSLLRRFQSLQRRDSRRLVRPQRPRASYRSGLPQRRLAGRGSGLRRCFE